MDQYIGEIRIFGGDYAPRGWAFCDGQILSISENDALFSLIGTTYGGDGQTTFALPDLRGRIPLSQGTTATDTTYRLASQGGTETVSLTTSELAAHSHGVSAQSTDGSTVNPEGQVWAKGVRQFSNAEPNETMHPDSITSTGGSQAHGNVMPYLVVSYIIALEGIYPSRL